MSSGYKRKWIYIQKGVIMRRNNHGSSVSDEAQRREIAIAYITGRIENELEHFARGLGVSTSVLAARVSGHLGAASLREGMGDSDRMRHLRQASAAMDEVDVAPAALATRTYKARARVNGEGAGAKSWAKFKTPAARQREMLRRQRVSAARRKLKNAAAKTVAAA